METFIVRFYRRTPKSLQDVAGTVERVGSGERAGFASERELLDRLLQAGTPRERGGDLHASDAPVEDPKRRAADQRMD
jgi:hypothetical protein